MKMPTDRVIPRATVEWSFAVLRALTMIGGTIALFLVPHPPEHKPQLVVLAWSFVSYKLLLFLTIWRWPAHLRRILLGTVALDLAYVALFVWLGGGLQSHFYLLFYLLIALVAAHFGPGLGVGAAAGGGLFYALASLPELTGFGWHHLAGRVVTFFLLGGSLGYLSQREREARAEAERLNEVLRDNQRHLELAYAQLQEAQERLVRSERLAVIGEMSAKVSHEVRNPLSSISLNVELLEDELAALPQSRRTEVAHLVRAIRSQVDVLSTVTEEYLRFAKLPKPTLRFTELPPVLEELADFVREELRARQVGLTVDVAHTLPTLRLDAAQIRQALLNLIRNAAEAMPEGGTITLGARVAAGQPANRALGRSGEIERDRIESADRQVNQAPGWVEITVTDTGIGIPAEDRERVFEPFFSSKAGGTGLGLAISREIAGEHGGTLTCESRPGHGTTFRLSLPPPETGARDDE